MKDKKIIFFWTPKKTKRDQTNITLEKQRTHRRRIAVACGAQKLQRTLYRLMVERAFASASVERKFASARNSTIQ